MHLMCNTNKNPSEETVESSWPWRHVRRPLFSKANANALRTYEIASLLDRIQTSFVWVFSSSIAAAPAPDAAWYVDTTMEETPTTLCNGVTAINAIIVEQFGLAMMAPLPILISFIASALTSGITSGTPSVMRNAELLSITMQPCRRARIRVHRLSYSYVETNDSGSNFFKFSSQPNQIVCVGAYHQNQKAWSNLVAHCRKKKASTRFS